MIMRALHVTAWTLAGILVLLTPIAGLATAWGGLDPVVGISATVGALALCIVCVALADATR